MKKRFNFVFLLFCIVVSTFLLIKSEIKLKQIRINFSEPFTAELKNIYFRYSRYLDAQWVGNGWDYSVPSRHYNEIDKNSFNNIRMQPTFADFYKYRKDAGANEKIYTAIENAFIALPPKQANAILQKGKYVSTRSFNEIIGMYLALDLVYDRPEIFGPKNRALIIKNIKAMYPWALRADDTENRAFIGAAYGLAILNHPIMFFSPEEKFEYLEIIKKKIDKGLESLDENYYYKEGIDREFSLHYHLVSADMLYYAGYILKNDSYIAISKKMLMLVRNSYPIGKLDWNQSARPTGIGLQTVFLRALGEKFLGNPQWKVYWDAEKIGHGFIDPKNVNRLAWKDEVDGTLNDDYSFSNMVELFKIFL